MKKKIYLLSILSLISISLFSGVKTVEADTTYALGNSQVASTRLEAENYISVGTTTNKHSKYVSGSVVEFGTLNATTNDYGIVNYTVNMAEEGQYVLKYGYFTSSATANLSISVNDASTKSMGTMLVNGRQGGTGGIGTGNNHRMVFYHNYEVSLNKGNNTIMIFSENAERVDFDFIELYRASDVYYYPIEKQLLGQQWVGERIEAEYGLNVSDVITRYSNAYGLGTQGNLSNGNAVGLGSNASNAATMKYIVNAKKAGKYHLQIAATCNNAVINTPQYWTINGNKQLLTLNTIVGTGSNSYTCVDKFEVDLIEGANEITFTAYAKISCNIDYFTLLDIDETKLDTILQAENYASGIIRCLPKLYPGATEGYVTEFANGREGYIAVNLDVEEEGYYDLYVRGFTGAQNAQLRLIVNDVTSVVDTEFNNNWLGSYPKIGIKDNYYPVYLKSGTNTVKMAFQTNYFTMDWFHISKSKVVGNNGTDFILNKGETYPVSLSNALVADYNVATIENGNLVAKNGGETYLSYQVSLPNGYKFYRKHKVVVNTESQENVNFVFNDETFFYDGTAKQITAIAPEGWSVTYRGYEKELVKPGTYVVKAIFESDTYYTNINGVNTNRVIKEATLTIEKGNYTGSDLVLEDQTFAYDGNAHSLVASAPEGWQVIYENNSRIYRGKVEVKAYFIHKYYNMVTKNATLIVE